VFSENLGEFKGQAVEDWTEDPEDPKQFEKVAYRLRVDYDSENSPLDLLSGMLQSKGVDRLQSLVVGAWQGDDSSAVPTDLIEALVSARDKLPNLKNIFFGDILSEENEISWIQLTDLSALLAAYPRLEHLTVRGSNDLSFGSLFHASLKELIIQSGGLPPSVIHEIAAAKLPEIEHLELWLGVPNYGGDATVEDLSPFMSGTLFPKLKYLGLKNSAIQDDIAGVVAVAPIVAKLDVLDLSEGTLGDEGARSLLSGTDIRKLKKLDLHHHFISQPVQKELQSLGLEVDLSEEQEPHEWRGELSRFTAVSE
jgi:hypothetical protein